MPFFQIIKLQTADNNSNYINAEKNVSYWSAFILLL